MARMIWVTDPTAGEAMASPVEVRGLEWLQGDVEPFVGTATVELRDWEELALEKRTRFSSDLRGMGLPPMLIGQGLKVRDAATAEVSKAVADFWRHHGVKYIQTPPEVEREVDLVYDSARSQAWARLRDWLAGRAIEVESRVPVDLRLPLFLLSAPGARGCSAEFTSGTGHEGNIGWSLTIAGTGLGGEGNVAVSTSATFEAANGQRKVIFLPVTVVLETLVLSERSGAPLHLYRIDIAGLDEQDPAPGSLSLAPDTEPPLGSFVKTYPLAGDTSGTITTFGYEYRRGKAGKLTVGVTTHDVELGLTAESRMQSAVGLKFKLRSGLDYRLHKTLEGNRVLWE
jgi:hypothetical protein